MKGQTNKASSRFAMGRQKGEGVGKNRRDEKGKMKETGGGMKKKLSKQQF